MSDVPSAARPCCRTDTWHDCKKTKQNLFCFSFSQCPLVVGVETLWWRFCQWHVCNGTLQQKNKKTSEISEECRDAFAATCFAFPTATKKILCQSCVQVNGRGFSDVCVCVWWFHYENKICVCVWKKTVVGVVMRSDCSATVVLLCCSSNTTNKHTFISKMIVSKSSFRFVERRFAGL